MLEIAGLSLATAAATMATTTRKHRHADRQEQIIARQQQQIADYQRQLAARPQPAPQGGGDVLSSIFCPPGYSTTLFTKECYPILPTPVTIMPSR